MADITKAGALFIRNNKILLCRKYDTTSKLIIPGGSIEDGETPIECVVREIKEELGVSTDTNNFMFYGSYEDIASFDDPTIHKTVQIILFSGDLVGTPIPSSEISEIIWFGSSSDLSQLSPIIKNKILPDLINKKTVNW